MRCPACGKTNEEGRAICVHCDHILDPSFLGEGFSNEAGDGPEDLSADAFDERTPPGGSEASSTHADPAPIQAPRPSQSRGSRFISSGSLDDCDEAQQMAGEPQWRDAEFDEIERQRAELRQSRSRQRRPPKSIADARGAADPNADFKSEFGQVAKDVEGTLNKLGELWKSLEMPDKLTAGGALAMFVLPIFPWVRITGKGTLAGLELGGWLLTLLAAGLGGLLVLRRNERAKQFQKGVIFAQGGAVAAALLFLLVRLASLGSIQPDSAPTTAVVFSVDPGFGLILSLLACLAAATGTGLTFRDKVLKR